MNSLISCHGIAGPLGAGKTTTILNYLESQSESEYTAVIVNDFGKAGLDAAILQEAGGATEVYNIPGGCLCCSTIHDMREAIMDVLKREKLTRIIIEPSGLVIMPDFVPYLERLCEEFNLELCPIIALLNPRRIKEVHYKSLPFFSSLIEHADILVANRIDQCSEAQLKHFREWTARLDPPKLHVLETKFGRIPTEVFDLKREAAVTPKEFPFHHEHHTHRESSGGFVGAVGIISEREFLDCIQKWIQEGFEGVEVLRFKALLPTDGGWRLFEIADGSDYVHEMPAAATAKLDWISRGELSEETMRAALAACRC